uniref:thiopurine S-methyltransferase-like n=1 Tax=Styela clava TaxID=7725 RepID=UPI00193A2680|nr:thiopurine S-methyltransferase-like [Styela clava]
MANPPKNQEWSTQDWNNHWDSGKLSKHIKKEYIEDLLRQEKLLFPDSGKSYRVLVPLCAKSYDMEWLASKGHSVIGLDCSETVLKEFFVEHNMEFSEAQDGNFKVFKSKSEELDITLYAGDIFNLPSLKFEKCDAVWDYASIVVIKPQERQKYANVITEKLTTDVSYLLCAFNFDGFVNPNGPAYHTSSKMVRDIFGDSFGIIELPDASTKHIFNGKAVAMKNFFHMTKNK